MPFRRACYALVLAAALSSCQNEPFGVSDGRVNLRLTTNADSVIVANVGSEGVRWVSWAPSDLMSPGLSGPAFWPRLLPGETARQPVSWENGRQLTLLYVNESALPDGPSQQLVIRRP